MPTVPIPAEVVGDMDTIRSRWEANRASAANVAMCAGDRLAESMSVGRHFSGRLVEVARIDRIVHPEYDRRRAAHRMARAIQPEGWMWR